MITKNATKFFEIFNNNMKKTVTIFPRLCYNVCMRKSENLAV